MPPKRTRKTTTADPAVVVAEAQPRPARRAAAAARKQPPPPAAPPVSPASKRCVKKCLEKADAPKRKHTVAFNPAGHFLTFYSQNFARFYQKGTDGTAPAGGVAAAARRASEALKKMEPDERVKYQYAGKK
jgi:hypothetical protein